MIFVVSNLGPFSVSVFFSGKNLPTKIRLRKHSNYKSIFCPCADFFPRTLQLSCTAYDEAEISSCRIELLSITEMEDKNPNPNRPLPPNAITVRLKIGVTARLNC